MLDRRGILNPDEAAKHFRLTRAEPSPDLAHLVGLLATGELEAQVGWRGPWDKAPEAADALLARRVTGKAVLDV